MRGCGLSYGLDSIRNVVLVSEWRSLWGIHWPLGCAFVWVEPRMDGLTNWA